MMLPWKRSAAQPIGLDLGCDSIKMLQLEIARNGAMTVLATARAEVPDAARRNPILRVELIESLLAQQPFVGRHVVLAVPRERLHVRTLRVPATSPQDLSTNVRTEAEKLFPFPANESQIEILLAGEVRQGGDHRHEAIALALRSVELSPLLDSLDRGRLTVDALDTEMTASLRALRQSQDDVQMVIDVGRSQTQVIIGSGRAVRFYKTVEIGGMHLLNAISKKLGISIDEARSLRHRFLTSEHGDRRDPVRDALLEATRSVAEELGQELIRCLRYFTVTFRGQRPVRAVLIGGEADDPQQRAIFHSSLNLPVEPADPLSCVDCSRMRAVDRRGSGAQWTMAMGLALRFAPRVTVAEPIAEVVHA